MCPRCAFIPLTIRYINKHQHHVPLVIYLPTHRLSQEKEVTASFEDLLFGQWIPQDCSYRLKFRIDFDIVAEFIDAYKFDNFHEHQGKGRDNILQFFKDRVGAKFMLFFLCDQVSLLLDSFVCYSCSSDKAIHD